MVRREVPLSPASFLIASLLIVNFKLANFTADLNLNKLPEEGGRGKKGLLKVEKEKLEPSLMSPKDKDNWSNINISSWPGKRSGRSEESELKTRNELVWSRKNFTAYLAVQNKTSPSMTDCHLHLRIINK